MSWGLAAYIIVGLIFIIFEHFSFDWNFEGMSAYKAGLNVALQVVHYTRCLIVWPWYVVEDFLVFLSNRDFEDEENNEPPDDGVV